MLIKSSYHHIIKSSYHPNEEIMNNVFVYCEIEKTTVAEVSQELLTKGRKLANELGVDLEAVVA
jgi:hypothetical protein